MTARIDSIYFFDYSKDIGHYDSIRNFASENMTYIGLALSTPKIRVNASPLEFAIASDNSSKIREYAIMQLANLNEIDKNLAVNSPRYFVVCYFDGSEQYFSYNEQFHNVFKMALQYKPQETPARDSENPYILQKTSTDSTRTQQAVTSSPSYITRKYRSQTAVRQESDDIPWIKLIIGVSIFFAIILIIIIGMMNDASTDSNLTPVTEPVSGTILSGREVYDGSKITIHAASGKSCVVKLKTSSGVERLSFYVRAGESVTVGVPVEYLYVYFASGDTWYGETELFGSKTKYSKDDDILRFEKGGSWVYTLKPVNDGNFSETPIDASEFKQ